MHARRILSQIRKELAQFRRDRLALALALVLPMMQLLLMGNSISFRVTNLPIIVQDLDDSTESRALIAAFRESASVYIVEWPTTRPPQEAFLANVARGCLIIPTHFGREKLRGRPAEVQFLVDGTDSNTARLLGGYAAQVTAAYNARPGAPVAAAIRLWFNPGLSSKLFYGPGIYVLVLSIFPPLLAALASSRESEQKTILQVYVSNIPASEFLLGKILAFTFIALGVCVPLWTILFLHFGVRLAGDPTPLILGTILYTLCVATFGTFVGVSIPSQLAAMQALQMGGFMLVLLLSGLLFPISNIPASLRWISHGVWGRHYIEIVRDALLQGGGWPATWYKVLALAGITVLFYFLAWRNIRRMQLED